MPAFAQLQGPVALVGPEIAFENTDVGRRNVTCHSALRFGLRASSAFSPCGDILREGEADLLASRNEK